MVHNDNRRSGSGELNLIVHPALSHTQPPRTSQGPTWPQSSWRACKTQSHSRSSRHSKQRPQVQQAGRPWMLMWQRRSVRMPHQGRQGRGRGRSCPSGSRQSSCWHGLEQDNCRHAVYTFVVRACNLQPYAIIGHAHAVRCTCHVFLHACCSIIHMQRHCAVVMSCKHHHRG